MTTPKTKQQFSQLPHLGVGLGLRRSIFEETMAHRDQIDWLEIVPENHMGKGGHSLEMLEIALEKGFPIVSHGVNLSVGSTDPLNEVYLAELKYLFKLVQPPWFSDHLCFSSVGGVFLNDLVPLPFTQEAIHYVAKRIREIQSHFDIPFLVENVSYYAAFGSDKMTEAQFLTEVLEQADCGLMLDVNNVYVNAQNHGYDPFEFLNEIPLERTVQIHIAGHLRQERLIVDTHGSAVCSEVFDILEAVLKRVPVKGILLERDNNIPALPELLDEMTEIRRIIDKIQKESSGETLLV